MIDIFFFSLAYNNLPIIMYNHNSLPTAKLLHFFLSSANFFQINFFKKFFQEYNQCQNIMVSDQIWVQTFCKSYQQTTLVGRELINIDM